MKRLPITSDERKFLQDIENTATLFMLMFKIYPTPINADALAFDMKWDLRKARRKLDDLSSDGFTALMKGQGYVLTSIARRMMVNFFGNLIALPLEAQALAQGVQVQAQQVLESQVVNVVEKTNAHTVRALVEEEDELTIINIENDNSTSTSSNAQNARADEFPTVRQILEASPILFANFEGKAVSLRNLNLEAIEPEEALAVMAHCYSQRKSDKNPRGLYAPAGLAHTMLQEGDKARKEFRDAPLEYLPEDYLEAIGLMDYACDVCNEPFKTRSTLNEHESLLFICQHKCGKRFHSSEELLAHHHEHAEEDALNAVLVCQPLDPQNRGARAWEMVKTQFEAEMPMASFDTWVRDTQPVEFDGQVLTVGARNAYCRDWLESRLEGKVNAMLIGITNQNVTVRFVAVYMSEDESND